MKRSPCAEAQLEDLYLWVVERAPSQDRVFFTVDESAKVVRGRSRPAWGRHSAQ